MLSRARLRLLSASVACLWLVWPRLSADQGAPPAIPDKAAFALVDLRSHRVIAEARPDILSAPIAPGSVLKVAALIAALEQGVIDSKTAVQCRRTLTVDGHVLTCVHPDAHRPLTAGEALAYSCNTFFATLAQRLSRAALDSVFIRMGLPPSSPQAGVVSSALGLEGVRVTPRALLDAFVKVATASPTIRIDTGTRQVVESGLRGAAMFGTASPIGAAGFTALAKTGTAPMPGGGYLGVVVAVSPAVAPTRAIVVVAPGGAGADAAALAANVLRRYEPPSPAAPTASVRLGVARRTGGYDVVAVPLETYVSRVVAGEAPRSQGSAAYQALAIVARTFALANRARHGGEGFDLCDLTHCQVLGSATPESTRAAIATEGLVLKDGTRPADVFFSGSCGGHTESPSRVWPGGVDHPYLPSRPDGACHAQPEWASRVAEPELRRVLQTAGLRGDGVRGFSVASRSPSGRVAELSVTGWAPDRISAGAFFRAAGHVLGWQVIKSTLFDVQPTATGVLFTGRGFGHGVGLCVLGAGNRAAGGAGRDAILAAYFPGLAVGRADASLPAGHDTDLRVMLPEADRGHLPDVRELAAAALRKVSRLLGIESPARVDVQFATTVAAFTRQTGMPWWVSARTVGTRIELQPFEALRTRGVLDTVLLHELTHVLADPILKDRPLWIREGVARWAAGEAVVARNPESCVLSDALFTEARSADDWRRAYDAAGSCVAAALARNPQWRELR